MKLKAIYIALAVLITLPSACLAEDKATYHPPETAAERSPDCAEAASTQMELTNCSVMKMETSRKQMHAAADEVRRRIANRPQKLKAFEKSQRAWEEYAQSQVDFLYVDHTGSAAPMCENDAASYLINQRTKQLNEAIQNSETGINICGPYVFYDPDPMPEKLLYRFKK